MIILFFIIRDLIVVFLSVRESSCRFFACTICAKVIGGLLSTLAVFRWFVSLFHCLACF